MKSVLPGKPLTGAFILAGSPLKNPDIRYATGFVATDPVVYLQHGRRKHLIVAVLELERARRTVAQTRVWFPEQLGVAPQRRGRLSAWIRGLMRQLGLRSITVAGDFPIGLAQTLRRQHLGVRVTRRPLFPQREIKSAAEQRQIGECQRAAVSAMRVACRLIADAAPALDGTLRLGQQVLTSERVQLAIHQTLLTQQCVGHGTIVAGGRQSADPHATGAGPLKAGEPIVIDIFPQHLRHGYWGDLTRTVVRGSASPRLRAMYRAVRAAQRAALATIKAGVTAARVHAAATREIQRRDFVTGVIQGKPQGFIHSTGHGIGLEIHEAPGIGQRPNRLRCGQVITVEPGLYYQDIGGMRIEDLVVVTRTGYRLVAPCEYVFEL